MSVRHKGKLNVEDWLRSLVGNSGVGGLMTSAMPVDFKEGEKEFVLEADLPGVSKEAIVVELNYDQILIGVERSYQRQEEWGKYIKQERGYGSQSRSFWVPGIDHEQVTASFANGVLTIRLPKRTKGATRIRRIPVQ